MHEGASRSEHFRTAIAGFIEARRDAKLKGKEDDAETASRYDYATWLADAARRVGQIQAVTHVLKATHPDARGSSLHAAPSTLPRHQEIGSHLLGETWAEDVVGNAAALDVFKFLKIEIEGKRLLEWIQAGDGDLQSALHADPRTAREWMDSFGALVRQDSRPTSHPLAKQVYWLVGDEPQDDTQYHLLQPMFSSSLAHAAHADIEDARFGEANKTVRQAWRSRVPADETYREYRNLVTRKLGGTKPQNVSQLNSERGGKNYLLASLPPPAWKPDGRIRLHNRDSALDAFLWFGGVRDLLATLQKFLLSEPEPTLETRRHRETLEQAISDELALFGVCVRTSDAPGWTREEHCRLPLCEQLWLDPERSLLPDRKDPGHPEWLDEDQSFRQAYERGNWADEVAERFGNWLNARLRETGLVTVALAERNHWTRQTLFDVAWPVPMKRNASGGRS